MDGLSNMNYSTRLTWPQSLPSAQSASPGYKLFPVGMLSQPSGGRLITLGHFHPGRGSVLSLTATGSYCGYRLAFLTCNASAKSTIHGLTEYLIHHHGVPHSIASDHFTTKEVQQWKKLMKFTGHTNVPHHPGAAGSKEWWASL